MLPPGRVRYCNRVVSFKTMKTIEIRDLKKTYRTKVKQPGLSGSVRSLFKPAHKITEALRGIDFSLEQGNALGFIGPNGSGKSTTIKILTGILHPTSGYVSVLGMTPYSNRQDLAVRIGSMFGQKSQLLLHLPPFDSFMLLGAIFNLKPAQTATRIAELSRKLEIADILYTPTRRLSLGQRMRCELAATLLHKPKVLLLDEPTIGLDVLAKQSFREIVKQLVKTEDVSLILASHDMGDIESVCSKVILINSGNILFDGSLKTLKGKYTSRKTINVQYTAEVSGERLRVLAGNGNMEILSAAGSLVTCQLDLKTGAMDSALAHLTRLGEIHDISVLSDSLEDIVAQIYAENSEK